MASEIFELKTSFLSMLDIRMARGLFFWRKVCLKWTSMELNASLHLIRNRKGGFA